jgi:hypothetical protein
VIIRNEAVQFNDLSSAPHDGLVDFGRLISTLLSQKCYDLMTISNKPPVLSPPARAPKKALQGRGNCLLLGVGQRSHWRAVPPGLDFIREVICRT